MRGTVTLRLAIGYGLLVMGAMAAMAAVLYFGIVGVIDRGIDEKLQTVSRQLSDSFKAGGIANLRDEIQEALNDNTDQDTEVYLLLGPTGTKIIGNIAALDAGQPDRLSDRHVVRYGRPSVSRLLPHRLMGGYTLITGRDLADLLEIRELVFRSLLIGGAIAVFLAVGGALLFRRRLDARIATIRFAARDVESGNLNRRIPASNGQDEFTNLDQSINQMLDRIQRLMDGVRDVSNAIAHDLRTPLGRIRSLLDEALSQPGSAEGLADRARDAIDNIDELIAVFDKLLQIAEAESGARRQSFSTVSLADIILNVVELYDASAEAKGISLVAEAFPNPMTFGDKDLLASATASLVDNAIKYAHSGARIAVRLSQDVDAVSILVQDDGPGIPASERTKVLTRFYRLDRSRNLPGNGLGLSIVSAITQLHGGSLSLEDAGPGLLARITLPRVDPAIPLNGGVAVKRTFETLS